MHSGFGRVVLASRLAPPLGCTHWAALTHSIYDSFGVMQVELDHLVQLQLHRIDSRRCQG